MLLEDIMKERKSFDFYIPVTKIQFSVLRDHLNEFVDKCPCQHCQNHLDDILAELNYFYSEYVFAGKPSADNKKE